MEIHNVLDMLRDSVAPFVLISGIGLLLLSMTNRLGRPIDRVRILCSQLGDASAEEQSFLIEEIRVLHRRSHILRTAIALATASIICVSVIVLLLFASLLFGIQQVFGVQVFFVLALAFLILSLVYFMRDIRLTLNSLKIEVNMQLRKLNIRP